MPCERRSEPRGVSECVDRLKSGMTPAAHPPEEHVVHVLKAPPRVEASDGHSPSRRVVELFAGVGGFHLGLEPSGWSVVWANQWEPSTRSQAAADCYRAHFPKVELVCEDIATVLDRGELDPSVIPVRRAAGWRLPMPGLLGGQDAQPGSRSDWPEGCAVVGDHRLLKMKRSPLILLENVDRLLKSPAARRGRDFAIMLASLADLGYSVEWRVINAADYGFPQKRRRVYILGRLDTLEPSDPYELLLRDGVLARAFGSFKRGAGRVDIDV